MERKEINESGKVKKRKKKDQLLHGITSPGCLHLLDILYSGEERKFGKHYKMRFFKEVTTRRLNFVTESSLP